MILINEITKNKFLNFIDAKTKVKYNLQDVLFDLGIEHILTFSIS